MSRAELGPHIASGFQSGVRNAAIGVLRQFRRSLFRPDNCEPRPPEPMQPRLSFAGFWVTAAHHQTAAN